MSDLHIPKELTDSYRIPFSEVVKHIKQLYKEKKNFITVITGDIFDKRETKPQSIQFYKKFSDTIAKYCPLIIIPGNHDF